MTQTDATPDLPKPGDVLAGKYEIVRLIGMGGMGAVFAANHLRLKQRVAIKLLKPELLNAADSVARFEREGRAAAQMTSANAARIFDVDLTPNGIPYMVIEYLDGHDVSQELRERGTLPVAEAVDIVLQACSAMAQAHTLGIVHRDLKPANLFLCPKGSGHIVKVLDFGVSKILSEEIPQTTTPSVSLGTPQYMSPEQILASKDVDLRSDIWSLGVILYKLISGKFPYECESATAFVVAVVTTDPLPLEELAEVPPGLADAVAKALRKRREDRWSSAEELARAIQPFGSGRVTFTPATVPPPPMVPAATAEVDALDVPVDIDTAAVTRAKAPSDAPATEANWTEGPTKSIVRGRRTFAASAAVLAGLAIAGIAIALLRAPGPNVPPASALPPPIATTIAAPATSASAEPPPVVPSASVAPIQVAPRKPAGRAPATTAPPGRTTHPVTAPPHDPVHL